MKNCGLHFIFILCISTTLFAQKSDVDISLSEVMEEPKRSTLIDVIGEGEDAFYAVRADVNMLKVKLTIERFGEGFKQTISEEIDLEADDHDLRYEGTIFFNNSLYIFGSYFSKKNDIEKLYAFKMNAATLNLDGNSKLVASIESDKNSSFSFSTSKSEKYFLITSYPGGDDDNVYAYTLNVFQNDLDEVWSKKVKSKYEPFTFYSKKSSVDDNGNAYILATQYTESTKGIKFGKPQYKQVMVSYTNAGSSENTFDLELKNRYINEISFRVMEDGNIVCGGFYSEKFGGGYKGVCFFSMNPETGSIIQEGYNEFSASELSEFMSDRKAEKGKEIYNFDLSDIILRDDGGLVLIGEYFNIVVSSYYNATTKSTTTTYTYYYNSLIVVSVSPDLSIDWLKVVPKKQVTRNDGGYYSSYALQVNDENIYVLFNDNDENLDNLKSDDKLKNYDGKNSIVSLVTISADGSMSKSLLIENREEGFILRPKVCEQVNVSEMIIYGELKNKFKVGKLTF